MSKKFSNKAIVLASALALGVALASPYDSNAQSGCCRGTSTLGAGSYFVSANSCYNSYGYCSTSISCSGGGTSNCVSRSCGC